jgi:N utilization substance protein A
MKKEELVESLIEFKDYKNIDRVTSSNIIESVFRSLIKKKYGDDSNFDIIINEHRGDFEIWQNRVVVHDGEVEYPNKEISISDAKLIDEDFEIGEDFASEIHLSSFERRSILNARQLIASKVGEHQKSELIERYQSLIGEMIHGEVYQIWKNEIMLLDDQGNELILPKSEMIMGDFFRKGESVLSVVSAVGFKNNNTRIEVSRTSNIFLQRLIEDEVSEVMDGTIEIKSISRRPGVKSKVVVESFDDRIDPVGTIVGMKGSKIKNITRELRNENIDVINYSKNEKLFIQRVLSPAKIEDIEIEGDTVIVYVEPSQIALAVGKGGSNITLASQVIGKKIDIYSTEQEEE